MPRSLICTFLVCYDRDKRRREFVYAVKNCRAVRGGNYDGRDGRELAVEILRPHQRQMQTYLCGATLVPVPTSGSGVNEPGDTLWSARDLAAMLAREYGVETRELLRRHTAIEKSSSEHGRRTLRRHVESIEITGPVPPGPIVLVDDVVTSGSTMCGCAELVLAAAPGVEVRGFAVAYVAGSSDGESLPDFAARQYEWTGLDGRPRNHMIASPLAKR